MACIITALQGCFCPPKKSTDDTTTKIEVSAIKVRELSEVKDIQIGETMSVPMSRRESFQEERRRST